MAALHRQWLLGLRTPPASASRLLGLIFEAYLQVPLEKVSKLIDFSLEALQWLNVDLHLWVRHFALEQAFYLIQKLKVDSLQIFDHVVNGPQRAAQLALEVLWLAFSLSRRRYYDIFYANDFLAIIQPLLLQICGQRMIEVVDAFEIILNDLVELLATYFELVEPHDDLAFGLLPNLYLVVLNQRPLRP